MLEEYADQVDMKLVMRASRFGESYVMVKEMMPTVRKEMPELVPEYMGEERPPRGTLAALLFRAHGLKVSWPKINSDPSFLFSNHRLLGNALSLG